MRWWWGGGGRGYLAVELHSSIVASLSAREVALASKLQPRNGQNRSEEDTVCETHLLLHLKTVVLKKCILSRALWLSGAKLGLYTTKD